MTPKEIQNLLSLATANFPNMQDKNLMPTAELWLKILSDIPYLVAEKALIKVLSTSKFFPNVAEIREAAVELTNPSLPTATEAWGEVVRAIRYYGFYREEEAIQSLTPSVAKIVKHLGWRELCTCEEPGVIRGQFRKAWETQTERDKEMAVLPANVRELITGTTKLLQKIN